jgi:hypothetical protein
MHTQSGYTESYVIRKHSYKCLIRSLTISTGYSYFILYRAACLLVSSSYNIITFHCWGYAQAACSLMASKYIFHHLRDNYACHYRHIKIKQYSTNAYIT